MSQQRRVNRDARQAADQLCNFIREQENTIQLIQPPEVEVEPNTVCKDCTHWHKIIDPGNCNLQLGECRGAPPSAQMLANGMKLAMWPVIKDTNPLCGMFKARTPLPLAEGNGQDRGA